jgi:hypothetical protein
MGTGGAFQAAFFLAQRRKGAKNAKAQRGGAKTNSPPRNPKSQIPNPNKNSSYPLERP